MVREYIKYKETDNLAVSTLQNYRDYCEGYIRDSFIESKPADKITEGELRNYYRYLLKQGHKRHRGGECGLSVSAVNHVLVLLKASFRYAYKQGHITKNPHEDIMKVKRGCALDKQYEDKDIRDKILQKEEIRLLVSSEKSKRDRFYNFYILLLHTGLRSGEARALKWTDIDFEQATLSVSKTLAEVGREFIVKPPKSKFSYRTIPLDREAVRVLKEQKRMQEEYKANVEGEIYKDRNIVFASEFGQYETAQRVLAHFKRLLKAIGVTTHHTVHDIRHTFCSLLIESNIDIKTVQRLMGHANSQITLEVYASMFEGSEAKAMQSAMKCLNEIASF